MSGSRRAAGFSLIEGLIGLVVFSVVLAGLGVFYRGQVLGLQQSSHLTDGSQAALTSLETMKNRLSAPAEFAQAYREAAHGSVRRSETLTLNHQAYEVVTRVDRAPAPLYGLRVVAEVGWKGNRRLVLGVLVPGPSPTL